MMMAVITFQLRRRAGEVSLLISASPYLIERLLRAFSRFSVCEAREVRATITVGSS
jgi:hypothetical protein